MDIIMDIRSGWVLNVLASVKSVRYQFSEAIQNSRFHTMQS